MRLARPSMMLLGLVLFSFSAVFTSPVRAQFDPIGDVAGNLQFWFDASEAASISHTGGLVDQWSNLVVANHAVGTGDERPLFVENAWGAGKHAVRFGADSLNDVLITENNSGFAGGDFGMTVFAAVQLNSDPLVFSSLVSQSNGCLDCGMSFIVGGVNGGAAGTDAWRPSGATTGSAVAVGQPTILSWTVPRWGDHRTGTRIAYDGVPEPTGSYNGQFGNELGGNPLKIGNWDQGRTDMQFPGDIAEVLVYDGELSRSDREAVEDYLGSKWMIDTTRPSLIRPNGEVELVGIDVFAAADQSVDKNRPVTQEFAPIRAIDNNLETFGSPTPSGNDVPTVIALELGERASINRLRVAKWVLTPGTSDLDGGGEEDFADLVIMATNDTGPLDQRTYQPVSGMVNGFNGTELLQAAAVNADGTILGDNHAADVHGEWWSVTFDAVEATALGIQISRSAGDEPFVHYGVTEYEAYAVPEPTGLIAALIGLLCVACSRRRGT